MSLIAYGQGAVLCGLKSPGVSAMPLLRLHLPCHTPAHISPAPGSASFNLCCNQSDLQWNAISAPACLLLANGFLLQVLIRKHLLNVVYKVSHSMGPACLCQTSSPIGMTFLECRTHFSCWLWKPFAGSVSHCRLPSLSLGLIVYPRLEFVM